MTRNTGIGSASESNWVADSDRDNRTKALELSEKRKEWEKGRKITHEKVIINGYTVTILKYNKQTK